MTILQTGDAAIEAYQNSEKGKRNAENEKFRVPIGTFKLGKFTQVKEVINGIEQIYFVYPLMRGNEVVGNITPTQIEKTAMWDFETSAVKKKDAEKYYLVPNALRPLLEADKVRLEGKTATISIATEIGYKVAYVGTEGYPDVESQKRAWQAKTAKRVYDVIIS